MSHVSGVRGGEGYLVIRPPLPFHPGIVMAVAMKRARPHSPGCRGPRTPGQTR